MVLKLGLVQTDEMVGAAEAEAHQGVIGPPCPHCTVHTVPQKSR